VLSSMKGLPDYYFAPFRPRSDLGPLAFHRNRAIFARTTALTVPAITARA